MKYIVISFILILLVLSCSYEKCTSYTPDIFLKERYEIRSFLNRSFYTSPEGAYLIDPQSRMIYFKADWPGNEIIESLDENQPWINNSHCNYEISLSDDYLKSFNQNNFYTNAASILLAHYFDKLSDYGFHKSIEKQTMYSYSNQFACNTWFNDRCNIIIIGNVYVDIESRTAFITADISEIYQEICEKK